MQQELQFFTLPSIHVLHVILGFLPMWVAWPALPLDSGISNGTGFGQCVSSSQHMHKRLDLGLHIGAYLPSWTSTITMKTSPGELAGLKEKMKDMWSNGGLNQLNLS